MGAHSVWAASGEPNAITPLTIVAKGGNIKVSGINVEKEHFTPERLLDESQKIQRLKEDLQRFAIQHFGFEPELN